MIVPRWPDRRFLLCNYDLEYRDAILMYPGILSYGERGLEHSESHKLPLDLLICNRGIVDKAEMGFEAIAGLTSARRRADNRISNSRTRHSGTGSFEF